MIPNLTGMAVFTTVVELGSFSAAARRLQMTQPAVSRQVSALEQRLDVQLLHRTTRRLALTEAGSVFHQHCRRMLAEAEAGEDAVTRLREAPRGLLKLNAPMSFGILHLAPVLPDFLASYPEVDVDLDLSDQVRDLLAGGYDVAVRIARLPDSSLRGRRLAGCRHVLCASPAYLADRGPPGKPIDLHAHRCLAFAYHDTPREWTLTGPDGRDYRVQVQAPVQTNSSLALRETALAGGGIALLPTFVAGPDIQAGRLVQVLPAYRLPEVDIHALYPQSHHPAPKVRVFIDFIAERLAPQPYWDAGVA